MAWILSEENFLKNVEFIDFLKVRASYGLSGSDITPGALLWNRKYGWSGGYILGGEYGSAEGLGEGRLPSTNLVYEKVTKMNLGIDFSLAKSFDVTLEFFKENWRDLFVSPANVSTVLGQSVAYENIGKTDNKGFEVGLYYHRTLRDFRIQAGGNFSFARSKEVGS